VREGTLAFLALLSLCSSPRGERRRLFHPTLNPQQLRGEISVLIFGVSLRRVSKMVDQLIILASSLFSRKSPAFVIVLIKRVR
jgi:hypothetical protein